MLKICQVQNISSIQRGIVVLLTTLLLGCQEENTRIEGVDPRPFELTSIAKSDIDMVVETHIRLSMRLLSELAIKLYKRNPAEWRRAGYQDMQQATDAIFSGGRYDLQSLQGYTSTEALRLTFDENYRGDRVLAFIEGLRSMILAAYKNQQSFYMLDELDPQKIYNAARNIEIAAWKLNHDRDRFGQPFLQANAIEGPVLNLSYERLFGQLISLHDSLALVIADKNNRTIKNVIQSVARAVFLPI